MSSSWEQVMARNACSTGDTDSESCVTAMTTPAKHDGCKDGIERKLESNGPTSKVLPHHGCKNLSGPQSRLLQRYLLQSRMLQAGNPFMHGKGLTQKFLDAWYVKEFEKLREEECTTCKYMQGESWSGHTPHTPWGHPSCHCLRCQLVDFSKCPGNRWMFPIGFQHDVLHKPEYIIQDYFLQLKVSRWLAGTVYAEPVPVQELPLDIRGV